MVHKELLATNITEIEVVESSENNEWQLAIDSLKTFFSETALPQDIHLNKHTYIFDVGVFIKSHLSFVENNQNRGVYVAYLDRLKELRRVIKRMNKKRLAAA